MLGGCAAAPDLSISPYGKAESSVSAVEPVEARVPPYTIEPGFANVQGKTPELSPQLLKALAADGCLLTESADKEFYQAYLLNSRPFITSDSLFHAYSTLLNDTVVAGESATLSPLLDEVLLAAHETMSDLLRNAPSGQQAAAEKALIYLAVAARLDGLRLDVPQDLEARVKTELEMIPSTSAHPEVQSTSVFAELGFSEPPDSRPRFRKAWEYLVRTPLRFGTDEELWTCLYVSHALAASGRWEQYRKLRRHQLTLGGPGEDPGPEEFLRLAGMDRKVFSRGSDPSFCKALREGLEPFSRPTVLDTDGGQPVPGLRLLPPGATVKAQLFDALLSPESAADGGPFSPTGEHIAMLLGAPVSGLPGAALVEQHKAHLGTSPGLYAQSLRTIASLNSPVGEGYPRFMTSPTWERKNQNAQMAAWAETEHAFDLFVKDNSSYLGGYLNELSFHGYVEPRPEFFERLADLTANTCRAFEESGLLADVQKYHQARIRALENEFAQREEELRKSWSLKLGSVWDIVSRPDAATAQHYHRLEKLCRALARLSRKELKGEPFSPADLLVLKGFGEELKYLSLNTTNIEVPPEPVGSVVLSWTDNQRSRRNYVGTGRPLRLWVVVPYQGKLYWSEGAASTYYEFQQPMSEDGWTDQSWKQEVSKSLVLQKHVPWLVQKKAVYSTSGNAPLQP